MSMPARLLKQAAREARITFPGRAKPRRDVVMSRHAVYRGLKRAWKRMSHTERGAERRRLRALVDGAR